MPRKNNELAEADGFKQAVESLFVGEKAKAQALADQKYDLVRQKLHELGGHALFTIGMTAFYLGITSSAIREARRRGNRNDPVGVAKRQKEDPFFGKHAARKDVILKWWAKILREKNGIEQEITGNVGLDFLSTLFIVFKDSKTGKPVVLCNRLSISVDTDLLERTLANQKTEVRALLPEKAIAMPWHEHQEKAAFIDAYREQIEEQHRAKILWLDRMEAQSKAESDRRELEESTPRR
ncbi:hypothetical protein [Xanthomonas axonopodis]